MTAIFGIIATPMGYVMEYIYQFVGNYGYSIIAFALLAKVLMLPLSIKQKRSMIVTQRLNPKLKELQKKYSGDSERYGREMQRLYDDAGASPMGGCGTSLMSLPLMLGLYYVVVMPLTYFMHLTAEEITALAGVLDVSTAKFGFQLTMAGLFGENMEALRAVCERVFAVDFNFYGLNLALTPDFKVLSMLWVLPLLSAATSWGYSHVMNTMNLYVQKLEGINEDEKAQQMTKSMTLFMPLMSAYFAFVLPAAVSIYWIANNLFSCVQEVVLTKYVLDKEKKEKELYETGGQRK